MFNTLKKLFQNRITLKVNKKRDLNLSKLGQFNRQQIVSLTNLGAIGRCLKKTLFLKLNLKILENLIIFTLPKTNYKLTILILHSLLFLQKQSSCTKEK